jgi:DMSO/TMAO reductase YedYZ molybdopterin-dependent catalytic subunit
MEVVMIRFSQAHWARRLPVLASLFVLFACASPGFTEDILLKVRGNVALPLSLSRVDFDAFPRTQLTAKDKAGASHDYDGVALTTILGKAGVPIKDAFKGAHAAKYLQVKGADGYVVVLALPEFDHQDFLVADKMDGKPLPDGQGPLQIIAPDDLHHSRWVKNVVELSVLTSN